ncbi:MAG: hypothetical protein LBG67_00195, partial [Campylobacteraceae bacterium]|nr:hypothetical protein [Campylobacteraceae bacterium]
YKSNWRKRRNINKKKKIIIGIIAILATLAIIDTAYYLFDEWYESKKGYSSALNILLFKKNTFNQSKIETKNFIIDLPKAHWASYKNSAYSYHGIPIDSYGCMFPDAHIWKYDNEEQAKEAMFFVFGNEKICKTFEQQPNKTINNFEVEVYDCTKEEKVQDRVYFYKNEYFWLPDYHHVFFKLQYDKFFEGVWLKE